MLILSFLVALTLVWAQTADAHHLKRSARGEAVSSLRPGCIRNYPMRHFYVWTKHKYHVRERPLTEGQKLHVKHLALCLATREKSDWAYGKKRKWREAFRARLAYYRLTPYPGPNGTRWAIPWYIVACESGGSWSAYNSSSAAGPYQIMGSWGRPWPVDSWEDKMAHHRIASRLYAGGAGSSNWVCA